MRTLMVKILWEHFKYEVAEESIEVYKPKKETNGDYSTNMALKAAKALEMDAMELAKKIGSSLEEEVNFFSNIEVVKPGFINFYLSDRKIYLGLDNTTYNVCQLIGESYNTKASELIKTHRDLKDFLSHDGIQSIQYIHSRTFSIINYFENEGISIPSVEGLYIGAFEGGLEKQIVKLIATYPSIIKDTVHNNEPEVFFNYLWELKDCFYRYHEGLFFRNLDGERLLAILKVLGGLRVLINHALSILDLDAPEKM